MGPIPPVPHCPCVTYPCTPLSIIPVPHCPCAHYRVPHTCTQLPMCPIVYGAHTPVCHTPCAPLPMCPSVYGAHTPCTPHHVSHCPCGLYYLYISNGYMGNGDTGGSGGTGVWGTWVMRPTGAKEYREYGYGVHRE